MTMTMTMAMTMNNNNDNKFINHEGWNETQALHVSCPYILML